MNEAEGEENCTRMNYVRKTVFMAHDVNKFA